ncbi:hypothetical protein Tco_0419339 [Tanacetum coccineum]
MDRLYKRKFVIVCHEKVVRIPLEGDEMLRVHGERTQGVVKTLMNTKTKVSCDLVIFRGEHQCRLLRREAWSSFEVSVGITKEGEVVTYLRFIANFSKIVKPHTSLTERNQKYEWGAEREDAFQTLKNDFYVKDKILATKSETSKVENVPVEMLRDLDQQMEKRADDGKANVVTDALSRKERVKPRRVRVMAMTIQYGVRVTILTAQTPMPAAAITYSSSPGYIPESNPEEDPEENDEEDPEEDPADYPADRGDEQGGLRSSI